MGSFLKRQAWGRGRDRGGAQGSFEGLKAKLPGGRGLAEGAGRSLAIQERGGSGAGPGAQRRTVAALRARLERRSPRRSRSPANGPGAARARGRRPPGPLRRERAAVPGLAPPPQRRLPLPLLRAAAERCGGAGLRHEDPRVRASGGPLGAAGLGVRRRRRRPAGLGSPPWGTGDETPGGRAGRLARARTPLTIPLPGAGGSA